MTSVKIPYIQTPDLGARSSRNNCEVFGMKYVSQDVTARQTWERPALHRMDAADAEANAGKLNDGMPIKS